MAASEKLQLETRRVVAAPPERVLAAWTTPDEMRKWWGPANVKCIAAEIDLRVGGSYRIGNELPDRTVLWIEGEFERIEAPRLLVYTWRVGDKSAADERVTVRFEPHGDGTEVIVKHERIASAELRDQHLNGWNGCLDGLEEYLA